MSISMIITLAIVVLMIVMIMSDKFSFGAPPLFACALLVLTGVSKMKVAFGGFVDTNVIMIAGFMAVMAAVQKTKLMEQVKQVMGNLAKKGGFKAYVLLIVLSMLGASIMTGTGYYAMVITIIATIPYNKKLPNSKLMLPVGFATSRPLLPISIAFYLGLSNSLLKSSGIDTIISYGKYGVMVTFMSIAYLLWSLLSYKLLPDYDISEGNSTSSMGIVEQGEDIELPFWKEIVTYILFLASIILMIFASKLGEVAYIFPCFATGILCFIKVFSFKEARANLFSPLIIMMASVIGVANALAETGFTTMVGKSVAGMMGSSINPFVLVLVFCLLTSACATLTGSSIGTIFIFAPIGITTCISLGLNPVALASAIVVSAWGGGFLPIDGCPAMILGMGRYKLSQFLKFAVPMYLIQIIGLAIGAVVMFPM